jgi:hypothetical protein
VPQCLYIRVVSVSAVVTIAWAYTECMGASIAKHKKQRAWELAVVVDVTLFTTIYSMQITHKRAYAVIVLMLVSYTTLCTFCLLPFSCVVQRFKFLAADVNQALI